MIYLSGIPYVSSISPQIENATSLGLFPGFTTANNTTSGLETRIDFVGTLSASGFDVPRATFESWVGAAAYLPPPVAALVLGRAQNVSRLIEEGGDGFPTLYLGGTADEQLDATTIVDTIGPLFTNFESQIIEGGGHMIFYDNTTIVVNSILTFVSRIEATKPYPGPQ